MSVQTSNRLTDLSARIRQARARAKVASVESAEQSIEAGRLLIEAKAECKHGDWGPFLEMAGVHERQARRLMQLARAGLKADTVSEMGGVKAALKHLAEKREPDADFVGLAALRFDRPLCPSDLEMEGRRFQDKLMSLAGVPPLVIFCLSAAKNYNLHMSRLMVLEDVCWAFRRLRDVVNDECKIPVEGALSVDEMLRLAVTVKMTAQRLLAEVSDELEYRFEVDEAGYDRDFDEIYSRFIAKFEKQLADATACKLKSDEMAKVDGDEVAGTWMAEQCERIRAEAMA